MQLDKVTVAIRPRQDWEAIDLGFRMVQQWWWPLYSSWLLTVVPFATIVYTLLWGHPVWSAFIVWLCKPLYERIPLYIVSRAVFGDMPTLRQVLKATPRLWFTRIFVPLTFYRLDFGRSFNWPVRQLEGLKGKQRRERARVLQKQSMGTAVNLTIIGFLFELTLMLTLIGLIMIFIPNHLLSRYFLDFFTGSNPVVAQYIFAFSFLFAHLVMGPFYAAAGFALYINRRTQLEAWDIEIAFRRIAERIRKLLGPVKSAASILLVVIFLGFTFSPGSSHAKSYDDLSNEQAKEIIEEIKADKDFGTKKKVKYWKRINKQEKKDKQEKDKNESSWLLDLISSFSKFLGITTEAVLWLAAVALVAIIIMAFIMWAPALRTNSKLPDKKKKTDYLFGMEVSPESLPDNLSQSALQLLSEGKLHPAISLLYRGALSYFIHNIGVNLKGSATERDCIRTVKNRDYQLSDATINYFQLLTYNWQLLAYAHRQPDLQTLQNLCKDWPQYFEVTSE